MLRLTALALAAGMLTACASTSASEDQTPTPDANETRAIDREARARIGREDLLTQMAFWAGEYQMFPNDLEAAQRFSEALRRGGRSERAVQVSSEALSRFPNDPELLTTYGLAQIAMRNPQAALQPLALVAAADAQNWRVRSALGAALDQLGRFQQARMAYQEALALAPNEPRILTNLGVSHLMAGEPQTAEPILRQAAGLPGAPPEARQNLAIALALMGRFQEAEQLQRVDLPPAQAAANVAYLRGLLSDPRRWDDLDPG